MNKSLIDVPVAMVFFSRPEQFRQVFEAVRKARPSKLFLIQDGAREGREDDVSNIEACRKIAENVDWKCEIYRNYSEKNLGCGMRVSSGITWAFEYVDALIILEDDTVPSESWFGFSAEILERYKDDQRMGMITGVNHLGMYKGCGNDYIFATCGSIAGWATWKRVWDNYDYNVTFASNEYYLQLLERVYYPQWLAKKLIKRTRLLYENAKTGKKRNSWSGPFGYATWLNSQLVIVPSKNMITNIGLTPGATNGGTSKSILPKKLQSIFDAPRYEMKFPLKHPKYIIEDRIYNDKLQIVMNGGQNPLYRFLRRVESYIRIILVKYLRFMK